MKLKNIKGLIKIKNNNEFYSDIELYIIFQINVVYPKITICSLNDFQ